MYFVYDFDGCKMTLESDGESITRLRFGVHEGMGEEKCCSLLDKAYKELNEYFKGERQNFDLPLAPQGTFWEKSVWKALCEIPYGETRSYQDIAIKTGNKKACQAVGRANGGNPIVIMIPCHRVIGADGSLHGYVAGMEMKEYLLTLENADFKS